MAQRNDLDINGGRQANNNRFGYLICNRDPDHRGGLVIESSPVEEVSLSPLPEMIAMLNDVKAMFNAHVALTGDVHDTDVSAGAEATADASDYATAVALANALKASYNTHIALGNSSGHARGADVTNGVAEANASTVATLCTLVEALEDEYTDHRALASGTGHTAADETNAVTAPAYGAKTCSTCKIPANSLGIGVSSYVKEGAATAVNYDVGIGGDATRFVSNELDTLDKAAMHVGDAWDRYTSETAIIITPDARPTTTAGKILVQAHYIRLLPLVAGGND